MSYRDEFNSVPPLDPVAAAGPFPPWWRPFARRRWHRTVESVREGYEYTAMLMGIVVRSEP